MMIPYAKNGVISSMKYPDGFCQTINIRRKNIYKFLNRKFTYVPEAKNKA